MDPTWENVDTEMSPWASRRKAIISATIVLALSAGAFGMFWKFWYHTPNCSDNLKNGDEAGVDCGGSCSNVCDSGVLSPIVRWDPRMFEISPGVWSLVVYVENPNPDLEAVYAPYRFTIYGESNQVLEEIKGATILPQGRTVGIFEGSVSFKGEERPKRAVFELGKDIKWKKSGKASDGIEVNHGSLVRLDSAPRVEAKVKNNGIEEVEDIELVAVIFDGADNAIATSRTFIESLKKGESADVVFTWPRPFALGTKACEKPSNVMLLLDRSGSMAASVSSSTSSLAVAKSAAMSFVDQLRGGDRVGVVSFASQPKEPIEAALTSDFGSAKRAIESVNIEKSGTQYTNIFGALRSAWQELADFNEEEKPSKIMILLTDGVANNPKDPNGKTEADDVKYAESAALEESAKAKKEGLVIYTIGLGNDINAPFLKAAASGEENYFFAPTAADLQSIYQNISSAICEEVPARIEITYKIFGGGI